MPGLRGLRGAGGGAEADARAGDPAAPDGVRVGHRLLGPVLVLHGHVRDARHPRPRAGAGDRPGRRPRRPVDLGHHGGRRRAVDRRQPPHPRAAPQRPDEDPDVQQPDLRAHQGPGVADLRARHGHQVDPVRRAGLAVQPARAGARRGGHVRRPHDRPRPPSHDRRAARRRRARGQRVRRDLPELPGIQRRRVLGPDRQGQGGLQPHPARARRAGPLRARRRARRRPRRRRLAGDRGRRPR